MFSVREVGAEDYPVIGRMHRKLFSGGTRSIPSYSKGYWWLLYFDDLPHREPEPVGFAGMCQSFRYSNVGYLVRAGVLPRAQGLGLQKRLIRVRMSKARRLGWVYLVTDTWPDNYPSANSLISCGFRLYSPPKKERWAAHKGSLYWRKEL